MQLRLNKSGKFNIILLVLYFFSGTVPAQRPLSLNDSVDLAIRRSITYFSSQQNGIDPDVYLIFHFLHRKFDIALTVSKNEFISKLKSDSIVFNTYEPFLRLIEKTKFRKTFLGTTGRVDDITLAGIWFDHLKHKRVLEKRILAMNFERDYNVTHAFLALVIAKKYFNAHPEPGLLERLQARLLELAHPSDGRYSDIHIESVAMLTFAGSTGIQEDVFRRMLSFQNPNGSWFDSPAFSTAQLAETDFHYGCQHTTILALWAMLEFNTAPEKIHLTPLVVTGKCKRAR